MGWHRFSFIEIAEKFNKASKAGVSGADSYGMLLMRIGKAALLSIGKVIPPNSIMPSVVGGLSIAETTPAPVKST
jgi:hypothetical protein